MHLVWHIKLDPHISTHTAIVLHGSTCTSEASILIRCYWKSPLSGARIRAISSSLPNFHQWLEAQKSWISICGRVAGICARVAGICGKVAA